MATLSSPRSQAAPAPLLTDPVGRVLRPTRAEVDLGALTHNVEVLRRAAAPAGILAVVKADAYGHGLVPVAAHLAGQDIAGFGVALAEEGLRLREAGIRREILVLNGVYGRHHEEVLAARLTPVVYDLGQLEAFRRAARNRPFGVHLHLDTGMARLGIPSGELDPFLDGLEAVPGARVDGVMTHLARADDDPEETAAQLARFDAALRRIRARGHRPTTVHAGNSAATFRHAEAHFDQVRPGVALFGVPPCPGTGDALRLAMRWRTEVVALRELPAGAPVGYNAAFRTTRPTRVATVPVGYGDGLLWALGNRGGMLVDGRRCPILGRVSMDLTTLDVTDLPAVAVGDEVVILGEQVGRDGRTQDVLHPADLAREAGTIPYEILCAVSQRVPRVYR